MQTFLPYHEFYLSAQALDNKRLGKQRVEVLQLLKALKLKKEGVKAAWQNHPAALMWEGSEYWLLNYGLSICDEWDVRGFKDTCYAKISAYMDVFPLSEDPGSDCYPSWLGDEDFHRSHQSNLIRKDPAFYGPKFPGVPDNLPYVWPTNGVLTR